MTVVTLLLLNVSNNRKDGSENKRPDLVDSNKNNMGNTLVGNGSDVNVLFKTYRVGVCR